MISENCKNLTCRTNSKPGVKMAVFFGVAVCQKMAVFLGAVILRGQGEVPVSERCICEGVLVS